MTAAETWPGQLALPAPAGSPEGKKRIAGRRIRAGFGGELGRKLTPKGFPGGGKCGGGEAAGTLPPRQDAGRVPF
jgi:hypothetical protein